MSLLEKHKHGYIFPNRSLNRTRPSNLPMFLSLLFLSLVTQCQLCQAYSRITFCYSKENYEGRHFNTTVHRYLNAISEFDCGAHCYQHSCCRSANFRKIPSQDGRENCELLHLVEWEEHGKLQKNETYDYLIMVQPQRSFDYTCLSQALSCKNGGRYNESTKECSCRGGFVGKLCEKSNFESSLILRSQKSNISQLSEWLPWDSSWHICYRASENGWLSSTFHSRCDNKGPTVTIIRVGSYVFGGYTEKSWGGSSSYIQCSSSFVFSLKNKDDLEPFKAHVYQFQYAIYTGNNYGPTFGGGHDIYIANNAHASANSYSNFGHTYRPPSGYAVYGEDNTRALLAGSYKFTPSEVEVYYLH